MPIRSFYYIQLLNIIIALQILSLPNHRVTSLLSSNTEGAATNEMEQMSDMIAAPY